MKIRESLKSGIASAQESLKNPRVQKALKITAVAVATLALLAAAIAVAVLVSTPVLYLMFPIVGIGLAVACSIAKKKSNGNSIHEKYHGMPFGYESPVERINRDVFGMSSTPVYLRM